MASPRGFAVIVDVKVNFHIPLTVTATSADEAGKLAKTMAMAKVESDHPSVSRSAFSIDAEITNVMG